MIACHCGRRFATETARDDHRADGRCLTVHEMRDGTWRWTNHGWTRIPRPDPGDTLQPLKTQDITTPAPATRGIGDIAAALARDLVEMDQAEAIDLDKWPNAKALVDHHFPRDAA